jgi:hypothetical protein
MQVPNGRASGSNRAFQREAGITFSLVRIAGTTERPASHCDPHAQGGGYVPTTAEWLPDLKAELLAFPTGKHDDIVDALGLVGQLLDKWAAGRTPIIEAAAFVPPREYVEWRDEGPGLLSLKVL